jgi:hypothetical protein
VCLLCEPEEVIRVIAGRGAATFACGDGCVPANRVDGGIGSLHGMEERAGASGFACVTKRFYHDGVRDCGGRDTGTDALQTGDLG